MAGTMEPGSYQVSKDQTTVVESCFYDNGFWFRFRGLMMRKKLPPGHAILLAPCSSIHMCFMRFRIDAVFIDRDGTILAIRKSLTPWIGIAFCHKAWGVMELSAGAVDKAGLRVGDNLSFRDVPPPDPDG